MAIFTGETEKESGKKEFQEEKRDTQAKRDRGTQIDNKRNTGT